jgi:hypothetical protein
MHVIDKCLSDKSDSIHYTNSYDEYKSDYKLTNILDIKNNKLG